MIFKTALSCQQEELLPWERYSPSKAVVAAVAALAEDVECREDEEEGGVGIHILRKFAPDMLQILGIKILWPLESKGRQESLPVHWLEKVIQSFFARHAANGGTLSRSEPSLVANQVFIKSFFTKCNSCHQ